MLAIAPTAIEGLAEAAGLFYNGSSMMGIKREVKSLQCFDILKEFVECADPTGCGLGDAAISWNYQVCKLLQRLKMDS